MSTGSKLILLPAAYADIRELADYSSQAGWMGSEQFIDLVFSTLNDLAPIPGIGSLKNYRSRLLKGIRSWSVRGFRRILILYRPVEGGIEVIAISHGARNLKSILTCRLKNQQDES